MLEKRNRWFHKRILYTVEEMELVGGEEELGGSLNLVHSTTTTTPSVRWSDVKRQVKRRKRLREGTYMDVPRTSEKEGRLIG